MFRLILINQGRRFRVCCSCNGGLISKRVCLERQQNGVLLLMESERNGNLMSGNFKGKDRFGTEEERHAEQIDRKRIRSISSSILFDISLRISSGSSDQFVAAMDATVVVADYQSIVILVNLKHIPK